MLDELKDARRYNIRECFSTDERRDQTFVAMKRADVIFGHDVKTDNLFLAFGRKLLREIVATGLGFASQILVFDLLQSTDDLEVLIAAVRFTKGYDDYEATDGSEIDTTELEALYRLNADDFSSTKAIEIPNPPDEKE